MHSRSGDGVQREFPGEHDEAEDHVDDLQDRDGFYCVVEVLGPHVEEDLRPEDAVESCCELADGSGHDDETGPVVLDKLSHFDLKIFLCFASC